MNPRRIAVKFFASDPQAAPDLEPFIPMFHRFIQQSSVPGLLLDVANYIHVPNGPGVVLIGHDVDYGIDSTEGKTGLLTLRKRIGEEPLADALRDTLEKALIAAHEILADGSGNIALATDKLKIDVVDRLAGANDAAGFEAAKKEVAPVLAALYGDANVEITQVAGDSRTALALEIAASEAPDVAAMLARFGGGSQTRASDNVPGPAVPGQTDWDISVEQLKALRDSDAEFVLVDVREQHEVEICELGGQLIPLGTLENRAAELDKGAYIVVHCHLGPRSAHATKFLRANGFDNVWNLQGGIRAWIEKIDSTMQDY